MNRWAAISILLLILSGGTAHAQDARLNVVATTTLIADVARNVGGDLVNVTSMIPPNADIHAFDPAPEDARKFASADMVLVNGAGLEDFLGSLVENTAGGEPVVVSNGVKMLPFGKHAEDESVGILGEAGVCEVEGRHEDTAEQAKEEDHGHGSCDPHVWTDPRNVMIWARNIATAFAAADPAHAETYRANADAYIAQLEALDADVRDILSVVPEEKRILVTNHEFFAYFARAYGFEVVGAVITGGSTLTEPDPKTLANLITTLKETGVPAIFAEVSANPRLAEVVAGEAKITVVTTIYSDSLSDADGPAATYLDYLRYNAQTIADALTGGN